MSIRTFNHAQGHIGNRVYIDEQACIIGNVTLADDVSIWPMAVVRGDVNYITIGKGSNIQDNSTLHVGHKTQEQPKGSPLIIGDYVTVGHQVMLHGCTVGDRCLIGIGAIVLDNATIEDEVMLGAGSLVTPGKCLENGWLYLGSPAKKIRRLTDPERAHLLYSARHYLQLKNSYLSNLFISD